MTLNAHSSPPLPMSSPMRSPMSRSGSCLHSKTTTQFANVCSTPTARITPAASVATPMICAGSCVRIAANGCLSIHPPSATLKFRNRTMHPLTSAANGKVVSSIQRVHKRTEYHVTIS
jgi:hypothetical protein